MDPLAQSLKTSHRSSGPKIQSAQSDNKFETEQNLSKNFPQKSEGINPLAQALSKAGGRSADMPQGVDIEKQAQEKAKKDAEKQAFRLKLHKEINPGFDDLRDVYSAREEQTKKELEKTRQELQALTVEVRKFYKEVDIASFNQVVNPGQEGTGTKNFFSQLRRWIKFLTGQARSANHCLQVLQGKNKKKSARKIRGGMEISGSKYEQTATIFDQMDNSERSNAYSGN